MNNQAEYYDENDEQLTEADELDNAIFYRGTGWVPCDYCGGEAEE